MTPAESWSRRRFLATAALTAAASEWTVLLPWAGARAQERAVTPEMVRFSPEIEPILDLIERTPRERCVSMMMEQFRRGLPYGHFLKAAAYACSSHIFLSEPRCPRH